ncbi:MAG: hypothetical protein IPH61_09230 [Bacteroidetes bacterium]|nr:hypothetical protein [Bacteroidota bacterium]
MGLRMTKLHSAGFHFWYCRNTHRISFYYGSALVNYPINYGGKPYFLYLHGYQ